ncbi:MAG: DUF1349 domain-containing protein [Promethearchaeota archaeon]
MFHQPRLKKGQDTGLKLVLLVITSVIAANAGYIRAGDDEGYSGRGDGVLIQESGEANITCTNFTLLNDSDAFPDISLDINESTNGIIAGSEEFAFSIDGNEPTVFSNPHDDNFSDNLPAPFWYPYNNVSNNFVEFSGEIYVISGTNYEWGVRTGLVVYRNAPALVQKVVGDFTLKTRVSLAEITGRYESGGLIIKWGDNFFTYRFKDDALRLGLSQDDLFRGITLKQMAKPSEIWLKVERRGTFFTLDYSLDGVGYERFVERMFSSSKQVEVGIFSAQGGVLRVKNWDISPDIETFGAPGTNSTSTEEIKIKDIPFNSWNWTSNKIRLRVKTGTNLGYTPIFIVPVTNADGIINFTSFTMPLDEKSDFQYMLGVDGSSIGDLVPGSEVYAFDDEFMNSTPDRDQYINPHDDYFSSGSLRPFWSIYNSPNLSYSFLGGSINLTDQGNSSILPGSFDSPFLYQKIKGDFSLNVTFSGWKLLNGFNSFGLSIAGDDGNVLQVGVFEGGGTISYGFRLMNESSVMNSSLTEIGNPSVFETTLEIRIRRILNTTRMEIVFNLSEPIVLYMGSVKLNYDSVSRVGILVSNSCSILVDSWDISPSLEFKNLSTSGPAWIEVNGLSVHGTFLKDYHVGFGVNCTNSTFSRSNIYRVKVRDLDWENKGILFTYGVETTVLSSEGNILFSRMGSAQFDSEMLEDGHVVVVNGTISEGDVYEYAPDGTIVRHVDSAGGVGLAWPHDIDVLDNGNWLIADTGNNRVVELYPNDSIAWAWYAWDYFNKNDAKEGTSHLNDVDRLPNGNTLISLRNLDTIVEINPKGDVVWFYGRLAGHDTIKSQHNADRLVNGNTLVCDSENSRIIEINVSGDIVWQYGKASSDDELGWVRDADLLPNGDVLIGDGSTMFATLSKILCVNKESKDVVWYLDTPNPIYDIDVIDLNEIHVEIKSPLNQTYKVSRTIPINIQYNSGSADILYQVFDNTSSTWLDESPVTYNGTHPRFLDDGHLYTLFAWSETRRGLGNDVLSGHDYHAIPQENLSRVQFEVALASNIGSEDDLEFYMMAASNISTSVELLTSRGESMWHGSLSNLLNASILRYNINEMEVIHDGSILFCIDLWYSNGVNRTRIVEWVNETNYTILLEQDLHNLTRGFIDVDYLREENRFIAVSGTNNTIIQFYRNGTMNVLWNISKYNDLLGTTLPADGEAAFGKLIKLSSIEMLVPVTPDDTIVKFDEGGNVTWYVNRTQNSTSITSPRQLIAWQNGSIAFLNGTGAGKNIIAMDQSGTITWNSNDYPALATIEISRFTLLPNNQLCIMAGDRQSFFIAWFNGTIAKSYIVPHPSIDFELLISPVPVIVPSCNYTVVDPYAEEPMIFYNHLHDVGFDVYSRIYDVSNDSWVNGTDFKPVPGYPTEINTNLPVGTYVIELKINGTMSLSSLERCDSMLFFSTLNNSIYTFEITSDAQFFHGIDTPYLIQGKIDKNSGGSLAILAWSSLSHADNYTVYSWHARITSINESLSVVGTTNETWLVLDGESFPDAFFVVVGKNKYGESPVSNSIQLGFSSPGGGILPVLLWMLVGGGASFLALFLLHLKKPELFKKLQKNRGNSKDDCKEMENKQTKK